MAARCPRPTVYAIDRGVVVVMHDREFTARRKRHTIGLHVRLMCAQPDAVDVLRERHDELLDVLSWTDTAVVELAREAIGWDLALLAEINRPVARADEQLAQLLSDTRRRLGPRSGQ